MIRLLRLLCAAKQPRQLGARVVCPEVFAAKMAASFKEDK